MALTYQIEGVVDRSEAFPRKVRNARKWHRWTEEERQIVRRDYKGDWESTCQIAARLGVSPYGVKGQAAKMGIATLWSDRERWTPEEDARLAELINKQPVKVVANRMKRGLNSVVVRAKRLDLSRRDRDGWYTKAEVSEILGVDHKWVQRRMDEGLIRATVNGAQPTKNGGGYWRIQEADLKKYIIENCGDLNGRNVDLVQIVTILVDRLPTMLDRAET